MSISEMSVVIPAPRCLNSTKAHSYLFKGGLDRVVITLTDAIAAPTTEAACGEIASELCE